jgi:hypothetical protein
LEETLAGYLIMLLVLIPFFAFRVLSDTLGEGRLERMFFVDRASSIDGAKEGLTGALRSRAPLARVLHVVCRRR